MVKSNQSSSLQWKPLSLKSRVLSENLDLDGLIGVEELTDYSLDKVNNVAFISAPKSKIKNKSATKSKKDKKLKTKSKDNTFKVISSSESNEVSNSVNDKISEESTSLLSAKKKKKLKRTLSDINQDQSDCKKNKRSIESVTEIEKQSNVSTSRKKLKDKKKRKKLNKIKKSYMNSSISNNENISNTKTDIENESRRDDNNDFLNEMTEWVKLNIPEQIVKALYQKGFKTPTKIQSLVLPPALLARKNIVGAAETGSGKTLAFGIPILTGILNNLENESDDISQEDQEMIDEYEANSDNGESQPGDGDHMSNDFVKKRRNKLYALILAPTRELAIQVQNHLLDAGKHTPIKIACVLGGMSTEKQLRILNKCPHILVATPGRLWEFIQLGHFHLTSLNQLNFLVIDETDRMIESGHFPELKNILDRITINEDPSKFRQTFVFSATLTHSMKNSLKNKKGFNKKPSKSDPSVKKLRDLLKISHPKIVDITEKVGLTKTLTESKIFCKHDEKDSYVYYFILQHPGRTLVFCNSISTVKRLTQLLTMLQCSPLPLHASMNQRQRLKNLDRFRANANSILLATDVAARGLDIPGIEHVIHYHVPRTSEIYIHRSGRTARANKEGLTLVLVESEELQLYIKNFNSLEKKVDLPDFPIDEMFLGMVNKRVELAKSIEFLENKVRKNRPDNWLEKAAEDMDIIIDDENLIQPKESNRENSLMTKALNFKRNELKKLLGKSIQSYQNTLSVKSALSAVKESIEMTKEEKKLALKSRNKFKKKNRRRKGGKSSSESTGNS